MKRIHLICTSALLALALAGCGGTQTAGQAEYIGLDAAKAVALEDAGVQETSAQFSTAGLDKRNGIDYYDVEFTANGREYEYDIDAVTGVVIEYSVDGQSVAAASSSPAPEASPAATPQTSTTPTSSPTPQSQTTGQTTGQSAAITAEQAKEKALSQVPGATASDIYEFKADYDDGRIQYEGKIIYNGMEYEFEIDGYSGSIREWDSEPVGR